MSAPARLSRRSTSTSSSAEAVLGGGGWEPVAGAGLGFIISGDDPRAEALGYCHAVPTGRLGRNRINRRGRGHPVATARGTDIRRNDIAITSFFDARGCAPSDQRGELFRRR